VNHKVVEIGPRDGFQNVKEFISTDVKLEVIRRLVEAGIQKIQLTSFVSPKAIPQMQDAEIVTKAALEQHPQMDFFALVPNFTGAKLAVAAGLKEITPVLSLSETHNMANVRRTVKASEEEIEKIRQEFPEVKITQDIATVFGCPFEGRMEPAPLVDLVGRLSRLGISAFTLCDTIGVAYPAQIKNVLKQVKKAFPQAEFNIHIHDTRNMGILNNYIALANGADSVQTSLGGLGGCPFAPGATGNTATEDLVYLLNREGSAMEIEFTRLLGAAKYLKSKVTGNYSGHQADIVVPEGTVDYSCL